MLSHYGKTADAVENKLNTGALLADLSTSFDRCVHGVVAHKISKIEEFFSGKVDLHHPVTNKLQHVVVKQGNSGAPNNKKKKKCSPGNCTGTSVVSHSHI